MKRHVKISVNFLTGTFSNEDLFNAAFISGAGYCIEHVDFGMLYHTYFICVRGSNEAMKQSLISLAI